MTFILNDRVKQSISSVGSGTLTLGGTPSGFVSFSDGIGDNNTTYYAIENLPQWEVGIGTYDNGTLTRDVILNSSNNGNAIEIATGATPSVVFCNYPATRSVALDESGFLTSFDGAYAGVKFPDATTQNTAYKPSRVYRNVSSDTTLTTTDDFVFVDTTSGDVEITLPLATAMGGKTITFKFITGTGSVTIVPQGGDMLDSTTSFVIGYVNQSISTFSNQNDWYIV